MRAVCFLGLTSFQASAAQRYFAHEAVEDSHGVIAPWYKGQNGQLDYRARIAAGTLKRYPWTVSPKTGFAAPDYLYNSGWEAVINGQRVASACVGTCSVGPR